MRNDVNEGGRPIFRCRILTMMTTLQYVPNTITLGRAVLGVFVFGLLIGGQTERALLLYLFALSTDFLDGAIARKFSVTSDRGARVYEPLADATLVFATALGMAVAQRIHYLVLLTLGFGAIAYYLFMRSIPRVRFQAFRAAVEPTLDGVCIVGLGLVLAFFVGGAWPAIVALFFLVAAIAKRRRIMEHLSLWEHVGSKSSTARSRAVR